VTELFLLFLAGVWVVRVTMKPGLEEVGGLLGELAAFAGGTVDESRGRH